MLVNADPIGRGYLGSNDVNEKSAIIQVNIENDNAWTIMVAIHAYSKREITVL